MRQQRRSPSATVLQERRGWGGAFAALAVVALAAAGGSAGLSLATATSASAANTAPGPVLVTAGDIACGPNDPSYNGGSGTASACAMAATAKEVHSIAPQYLMPLGDTQYDATGSQGQQPPLSFYQHSYNRSWGSLTGVAKTNTHPIAGNQEYGDVSDSGQPPLASASNYFTNFGPSGLRELPSSVTGPSSDWYSYNIPVSGGTWHVVALDSECNAIGGCGSGSPEETWFRNDLASNAGRCTMVALHEPRWSVGQFGTPDDFATLWDDAVANHVSMLLDGHVHSYEHFGPLDDNGQPSSSGTSEFIVGTGGVNLGGDPGGGAPGLVAADYSHFGVLKLGLTSTGANYAFRTVGGAVPDSGTVPCGQASSGPAPTVSSASPIDGPSTGGTPSTITGTNLKTATAVNFGSTPATALHVVSATQVTATAPPGSGTVDVTVTTPGGTSATTPADQYDYTQAANGYAVTLQASATTAPIGGSITLTATANQDVGPTPYGLYIYDVTTGAAVTHVGSGTTVTTTVAQNAASTQRYVAYITNNGPTNIQAATAPTVITWSGSPPPPPPPPVSAPTVSSASPIDGPSTGGTPVTITGTNLKTATAVNFGSTPATALHLVSATQVTATAPPGSGTVDVTVTTPGGTSATTPADQYDYTQAANGYAVTLQASATTAPIGGSITLTATANQDVGPTPYGLYIYDVTTGAAVTHVGSGTTVTTTVAQNAASTQRYVAYITNNGPTNIQAATAPTVITWS